MPDKYNQGAAHPRRRLSVAIFAGLALTLYAMCPAAIGADAADVSVTSYPIAEFKVGSSQKTFGKLEFVGGLRMRSSQSSFGSLSSIRFKPDGRTFIAVLDTGRWLTGAVERNKNGQLANISDVHISRMLDEEGRPAKRKSEMDAEGLALRHGKAYVSYERFHRIGIFADTDLADAKPVGQLPHLIPDDELRRNGGLETLVASPANSALKGAMVTVAENSIDRNGNFFAAILEGPHKGLFTVKPHGSFAITDGAFLANGDLLLLERRFNLAEGMGMRLRRIHGDDIRPGALVDGDMLIEADLSYQIDNMEGIDVVAGQDGLTHIILVSDDNNSFLQRNLMLEFKLLN